MDLKSMPLIVLICYVIGEIYKVIFKNKKELYKLIPTLLGITGGIIGLIIYKTEPKMIGENIWYALGIGIISGLTSTGTNQIYKQLTKNEIDKENNKKKENLND